MAESSHGNGREPMPPEKRKRLQKCYEHASRQMGQESYNFDYVTDLFGQCVVGDPANLVYAQSFLANLKKKYNNNKKGSNLAGFKGMGARGMVKKALVQKDWDGAIKAGLEALKLNPWDSATLLQMATAAREASYDEVQMFYLKSALDGNPKDVEVLRNVAKALGERTMFDQAIQLWHRIEEIRPGDNEAEKMISRLAVEKTLATAASRDRDPSTMKFAREGQKQLDSATVEQADVEKLEKAIAKKPGELNNYLELADLYIRDGDYGKAVEVLTRAQDVASGDANVRERLEDVQLRHLRQQISQAETEAQGGNEQAKAKYKDLRKQWARKELEVYKHRAERNPGNLAFKYDLGLRFYVNGLYNEAIKEFQQAKNDSRRRGLCLLELAKCFEKIQQPRMAMNHFDQAIEEIPDRDDAKKKDALYRAAKLAINERHLDTAGRHLNRLAEMDFNYKDVSALLDSVAKMREQGENREPQDTHDKS